jgi:transposase
LVARRLAIPGIGPIIAARIAALVPDPSVFRSGRDFAAWIGLVPRQNSSGGKSRLCGISKRGNGSLRRLLVGSAMAAMFRSKVLRADPWLCRLRSRKPTMLAAVALANKIARTVWAVLRRGEAWRPAGSSRPHEPAADALGRDGETVSRSNRETYVCEGKTSRWM